MATYSKGVRTQLEALTSRLLIEQKIKDGAENLLQVFKLGGDKESLRSQVEAELAAAELKIEALDRRVKELQASINGADASFPEMVATN